MNEKVKGIEELDSVIFEPYRQMIYAFKTGTVPNYLKVGDTYRPVAVRLNEWKGKFPDLKKQYEASAQVDEDVYFRDYAVHKYLEIDLKKQRLLRDSANEIYYSNEFFKDVNINDLDEALEDIKIATIVKKLELSMTIIARKTRRKRCFITLVKVSGSLEKIKKKS